MFKVSTVLVYCLISLSSFAQNQEFGPLVITDQQISYSGAGIASYISSKLDSLEESHTQRRNFFKNELNILNQQNEYPLGFVQYVRNTKFVLVAHFDLQETYTDGNMSEGQKIEIYNKWRTKNLPVVQPGVVYIHYLTGGARLYRLDQAIHLLFQYYMAEVRLNQAHPLQ